MKVQPDIPPTVQCQKVRLSQILGNNDQAPGDGSSVQGRGLLKRGRLAVDGRTDGDGLRAEVVVGGRAHHGVAHAKGMLHQAASLASKQSR